MRVNCDGCDRPIQQGETYYETTTAKLTLGAPPPTYAAKTYACETCDGKDGRLRDVAATMASTLRDVLGIVEVRPDYPWKGGALKNQMREDVTAYELLGLDDLTHDLTQGT